jgi:hypothetical protein
MVGPVQNAGESSENNDGNPEITGLHGGYPTKVMGISGGATTQRLHRK